MAMADSIRYAFGLAGKHRLRRIKTAILQFRFLNAFRHGDRKALGLVVPRDGRSGFVPLDRSLFHDGVVDMARSSLTAEDVSFAGIRVAENHTVTEPDPPPSVKAHNSRNRSGPKSARDAVRAAVDELWLDETFRKLPRIRQLDKVKERILGIDPEIDGVIQRGSEKTQMGHIADRIHELSKSPT